jgi:CheY-like chemotaxis protein
MPGTQRAIAVIDDDAAFAELVCDILASEGHEGTTVPPRGDAIGTLRALQPAAVVVDWRLGEGQQAPTAEPLLSAIAADPELARTPIIVCSADMAALREAVPQLPSSLRVSAVEKPFSVDAFVRVLEEALRGGA